MDSLVRRVEGPQTNYPAMPPPPGVIPNFVNYPSREHEIIVIYSVFLGVSAFFVALRMYTRIFITRCVGYDDCKPPLSIFLFISVENWADHGLDTMIAALVRPHPGPRFDRITHQKLTKAPSRR